MSHKCCENGTTKKNHGGSLKVGADPEIFPDAEDNLISIPVRARTDTESNICPIQDTTAIGIKSWEPDQIFAAPHSQPPA
jgi:hypothetical protein